MTTRVYVVCCSAGVRSFARAPDAFAWFWRALCSAPVPRFLGEGGGSAFELPERFAQALGTELASRGRNAVFQAQVVPNISWRICIPASEEWVEEWVKETVLTPAMTTGARYTNGSLIVTLADGSTVVRSAVVKRVRSGWLWRDCTTFLIDVKSGRQVAATSTPDCTTMTVEGASVPVTERVRRQRCATKLAQTLAELGLLG